MTDALAARIKKHEGLRLKPYRCPTGHWTIGFGHKLLPGEFDLYKNGITRAEAEEIFQEDFARAKDAVFRALPWALQMDDAIKDTLIEMVFQMGIVGLLKFRRFLAALKTGDLKTAHDEMLDSAWYAQTPKRCKYLAKLVLDGYDDPVVA